ncbi:MAG TPA: DMT family transporter [Brevundimonas sp.]|nr:DMT family transporter [Brevundimonas sp.]
MTTAVAHAVLKSGSDRLATRFLIGLTEAAVALPVVVWVGLPPPILWPWLFLSAALHVTYQLVLVRAYDTADFSLAFPLARGVAPVMTALLGLVLLNEGLTLTSLSGIAAVTVGLVLMAAQKGLRADAVAAAVAAGVLTTAYTLADAYAVRLAEAPITFIAWFFLLEGLLLAPIVVAVRRYGLASAIATDWRTGVAAGFVSLIGFGAALWALALAPAGAVSALRETSVAFAVVIGVLFLKERLSLRRAIGAAVITGGAAAILLG